MTGEEYKRLSLKEFDRAADKFDDDDPSVYNMCRKDYPDVYEPAQNPASGRATYFKGYGIKQQFIDVVYESYRNSSSQQALAERGCSCLLKS